MNIKILPYEKMNYKDGEVAVDNVQITYIQNGDCTSSEDDVQTITLATKNNGVARFMSIKTDDWAFDDINELTQIINDFKKRANIECE